MAYSQTPYRPTAHPPATSTDMHNMRKWSAALALFLALLALLVSLQLFQATAEGASKRTLRRSIAALTEIDPLLDRNYDQLQRDAQNADAGANVELAGFPIDVPLQPAEVQGRTKEQLRDVLLDRAAAAMYEQGAGSLHDAAARDGSVGRFSVAGLTEHGLGFLRSRNHNILAVTTAALAVLSAALALALAASCRGFGRITSIGIVVMAAAVPVVAGGIGARLYMRTASSSDTEFIRREFLEIGKGLAWIPIRDGLAFAVFGLALLLIGYGCAALVDRPASRRALSAGR